KTNRYTSCADRARVEHGGDDLIGFAHARIDHWVGRTRDAAPGGYPRAVALLRTTYDLIDRLKTWEEERGLDGSTEFARICAALDAGHAALPDAAPRAGTLTSGCATPRPSGEDAARAVLQARIATLRASSEASASEAAGWSAEATRWSREAARLDAELSAAIQRLERTAQALAASQRRIEVIEASTCWRVTAGPRWLAEQARRLARRR
ncbi:MAG TPA: hypothetical protein VIZ17_03655, partial [Acetobacteraceae bacterium]